MDAKASRGWAVIAPSGEIEVRSVSPTRQAAIINGLVVAFQTMIHSTMSDADIEHLWRIAIDRTPGLRVAEVSIIEIRG